MATEKPYPIIVIGAGAAGLVVAIGAAKAGKKVLLVERGTYGGDCTNFGCIPSKSLIASSHAAHYSQHSDCWGIHHQKIAVDARGALERTRNIVEEIKSHEDPEALAKHGVDTLTGMAAFKDPHTLEVRMETGETKTVKGKTLVIATGSHPFIPPIKGLEHVNYLTNETIFNLKEIPKTLAVIGGGPIGSELSQAFQRLGSQVTIIQHDANILKKEDDTARKTLGKVFEREGIVLKMNCEPIEVQSQDQMIRIRLKNTGSEEEEILKVDHLLISAGRRASIDTLNLDQIGVAVNKKGITVDPYGRTSLKHIFAIGDVSGHQQFTHVAENQARCVLTNLLLPWPLKTKLSGQPVPRVTYTDPEIASVGMSEREAADTYGAKKIAVYTVPFTEVDRAITTGRTEGFVKMITKKWSSKILGATIVAPRAGEMLSQITTAMLGNLPLRKLASLIHPYPTYNLAIRKAADQWLTKTMLPTFFKLIGKHK